MNQQPTKKLYTIGFVQCPADPLKLIGDHIEIDSSSDSIKIYLKGKVTFWGEKKNILFVWIKEVMTQKEKESADLFDQGIRDSVNKTKAMMNEYEQIRHIQDLRRMGII